MGSGTMTEAEQYGVTCKGQLQVSTGFTATMEFSFLDGTHAGQVGHFEGKFEPVPDTEFYELKGTLALGGKKFPAVFKQTSQNTKTELTATSLKRTTFIETLVRVSMELYPTKPPWKAFKEMIEVRFLPRAIIDYDVDMDDEKIIEAFESHTKIVKKVYKKYAMTKDERGTFKSAKLHAHAGDTPTPTGRTSFAGGLLGGLLGHEENHDEDNRLVKRRKLIASGHFDYDVIHMSWECWEEFLHDLFKVGGIDYSNGPSKRQHLISFFSAQDIFDFEKSGELSELDLEEFKEAVAKTMHFCFQSSGRGRRKGPTIYDKLDNCFKWMSNKKVAN